MKLFPALALLLFTVLSQAEDSASPVGPPLSSADFQELTTRSPFLRSVDPEKSLFVTGIARIEGEVVVSVHDTTKDKSILVSSAGEASGWRLLEVEGDASEPDSVKVRLRLPDGMDVALRYQDNASPQGSISRARLKTRLNEGQLKEARSAAINYKKGFSSDGYPDAPSRDTIAKLSRLSVDQREVINQEMLDLRNQGLGSSARLKIYRSKVDQALGGRR